MSLHVQWDSTDTDTDTGTHTDGRTDIPRDKNAETDMDTTTITLFQIEESLLLEVQDPNTGRIKSPGSVPHGAESKLAPPVSEDSIPLGRVVVASAPVRVDLAGGWSDTPPICYETEGAVSQI